MDILQRDVVFLGGEAEIVMELRADLRHCHGLARELFQRREARVIGAVRGDVAGILEAGHLAIAAGDDPQDALAGEAVERGRHAGAAEIDVARGRRDRDRLRRIEEHDLRVEPFIAEIAALVGDEDRPDREGLHDADLDRHRRRRPCRCCDRQRQAKAADNSS